MLAIKELKNDPRHPLVDAAGECAQVDWGCADSVEMPGGRRRLSFFTMVLCHSRMLHAEFFIGEGLEYWLAGHRHAFEHFGGVPEKVMVDNCKTAVLRPRAADAAAELNPAYADFAGHYGFRILPCNVRRPNEKGRVESAVGYIRTGFLAGREMRTPEIMNLALSDWLENVANRRVHGTTGRRPCDMFETEERPALRPLPEGPHECCSVHQAAADARFRVAVDGNLYSVPSSAASRRVVVRRYADRVVIRAPGGELLADHPRCGGRRQQVADPGHERALVMRMRHARDRRLLENFLALGPAAAGYLAGLREKRPDWRTHAARINTLAGIHGRDELARVLADAFENSAFSAEYIFNILDARKRLAPEPGPLHVTRRADLLEMRTPEPDLDIY
jgi:hypothetical protein